MPIEPHVNKNRHNTKSRTARDQEGLTGPRNAVDPQQWWNGWESRIHPLFEGLVSQDPASAARTVFAGPGMLILVIISIAGLVMFR